jgi:hypothetical protein
VFSENFLRVFFYSCDHIGGICWQGLLAKLILLGVSMTPLKPISVQKGSSGFVLKEKRQHSCTIEQEQIKKMSESNDHLPLHYVPMRLDYSYALLQSNIIILVQ